MVESGSNTNISRRDFLRFWPSAFYGAMVHKAVRAEMEKWGGGARTSTGSEGVSNSGSAGASAEGVLLSNEHPDSFRLCEAGLVKPDWLKELIWRKGKLDEVFKYQPEEVDHWGRLVQNPDGTYSGDCDSYAILAYDMCFRDLRHEDDKMGAFLVIFEFQKRVVSDRPDRKRAVISSQPPTYHMGLMVTDGGIWALLDNGVLENQGVAGPEKTRDALMGMIAANYSKKRRRDNLLVRRHTEETVNWAKGWGIPAGMRLSSEPSDQLQQMFDQQSVQIFPI